MAKWNMPDEAAEIARLLAENARLRAALTDAIEVLDEITGTHAPETLVSLWLDAQGAAARARAALGSAS